MAHDKYRFGIQNEELKDTLLRLGKGIGDTVAPQYAQEIVTSSIDDFEFRILTIMYAEKRKP